MQKQEKIETREIDLFEETDQEKSKQDEEELQIIESNEKILNQPLTSTTSEPKPEFKKPSIVKIEKVVSKTNNKQITTNQNGEEIQPYTKHWLAIQFSYGKNFEQKYWENFGSFRVYDNRNWIGPQTKLAEVKSMLEDHLGLSEDEEIKSIKELVAELHGKTCRVKSSAWSFGKRNGFRNDIVEFIESE